MPRRRSRPISHWVFSSHSQRHFYSHSQPQSSPGKAPEIPRGEIDHLHFGEVEGHPFVQVIYRQPQTTHPRRLEPLLYSPFSLPGLIAQGMRTRLTKAGGVLTYRLAVTRSLVRFFFTYTNNHTRSRRYKTPRVLLDATARLFGQLHLIWLPKPQLHQEGQE